MKAVLVIDMPNSCVECPYCGFEQFTHNPACVICESHFCKDEDIENNRSVICPLRPLPHKLQADWYTDGYKEGFNACLEEIIGETECTTQKKDT